MVDGARFADLDSATDTMSDLPYRLSLHTLDGEAGERAQALVRKMADRDQLEPHEIEEALASDDERVLVALCDAAMALRTYTDDLRVRLYERVTSMAEKEGVVWNPVLDAMDRGMVWPMAFNYKRVRGEDGARELKSGSDVVAGLRPWLSSLENAGDALPLMEFESGEVRREVLRHVGGVTPSFTRVVLAKSSGFGRLLAANKNLPDDIVRLLAERALETLAAEPGNYATRSALTTWDKRSNAVELLGNLKEAGHTVPADVIRRLVDAMGLEWVRSQEITRAFVRMGEQVPTEEIERAVERTGYGVYGQTLLVHPNASIELQRRAIQEASGKHLFELRAAFSERKELRRDPVIRKRLLGTTSASALAPLLETDDEELFAEAFSALLRAQPATVIGLLNEGGWASRREPWKEKPEWVERLTGAPYWGQIVDRVLGRGSVQEIHALFDCESGRQEIRLQRALIEHDKVTRAQLMDVAEVARGDTFRTLIARMTSVDVAGALKLLEEGEAPGLADLEPRDLAPLLSHGHPEVRQRALRALRTASLRETGGHGKKSRAR